TPPAPQASYGVQTAVGAAAILAATPLLIPVDGGKTMEVDIDSIQQLTDLGKFGGRLGREALETIRDGRIIQGHTPTMPQRMNARTGEKYARIRRHGPDGPNVRAVGALFLLWDAFMLALDYQEMKEEVEMSRQALGQGRCIPPLCT